MRAQMEWPGTNQACGQFNHLSVSPLVNQGQETMRGSGTVCAVVCCLPAWRKAAGMCQESGFVREKVLISEKTDRPLQRSETTRRQEHQTRSREGFWRFLQQLETLNPAGEAWGVRLPPSPALWAGAGPGLWHLGMIYGTWAHPMVFGHGL